MPFRFTNEHAMSLVAPHLLPGEQVLHRSRGVEKPWYSRLFSRMGSLFWRYWLVVGTNQRVIFIRHKGLFGGYGMKEVESVQLAHVDELRLGWGIFNKNLRVRSAAARINRTVVIPRFWLKQNLPDGEGMVQTWQRTRGSLPPGAMPAQQLRA
jgi:hypothetical protein